MMPNEKEIRNICANPRSVFSLLTAEEQAELLNNLTVITYKKNEYIYHEGDRPLSFVFLVEGKVKIFKEGLGRRELIIRMIKPMGFVGYRALLAKEKHIASAVTLERSVAWHINPFFFFERLMKNHDFSGKILGKLARELGFANARTINLSQKHIRGRLAESLLLLKQKYGFERDKVTLKIYLSREDIASLSNMTAPNAIRTLAAFAGEKVIAVDGRKIKILNLEQLERISSMG